MDRSASGLLRKTSHVWKSDRGKGLSRIPRKIMWRRGTQFSWVGAIIPSAAGGRRAHPPKGLGRLKKINKKEFKKALFSALTYTSSMEELQKKYTSINKVKDIKFPIVFEDNVLKLNTKNFLKLLEKTLNEFYGIAVQKKSKRAGIGKMRGRKYKKNAGILFVVGKNEDYKIKGIEVRKTKELLISDLANNGARLTIFSENAIKDLESIKSGKLTKETQK